MGHIPVRTCIACRRADAQDRLVRLTTDDGEVVVDRAARRSGRGAYLCPSSSCFDAALRRDGAALRRALGRGGPLRIERERLTDQWHAALEDTTTAGSRPGQQTTAGAVRQSTTAGAVRQSATAGAVRQSATAGAVRQSTTAGAVRGG